MSVENDDSLVHAGDVIKRIFENLSVGGLSEYSQLSKNWIQIVGKEMAFHVIPQDIVNGVLILEADHPGWVQKVRLSQQQILRQIHDRYSPLDIKKLKINVVPSVKN